MTEDDYKAEQKQIIVYALVPANCWGFPHDVSLDTEELAKRLLDRINEGRKNKGKPLLTTFQEAAKSRNLEIISLRLHPFEPLGH